MHMLISGRIRLKKQACSALSSEASLSALLSIQLSSSAADCIVLTVRHAVQTKLNQDHFLLGSGEARGRT